MDWVGTLALLLGLLFGLLATGLPVAFAFMAVNLLGVYLFMGGVAGLDALVRSILASLTVFTLVPIPLFVLMGSLLFHSGLAARSIDAVAKWMGRVPGRLSMIALSSGVLFAAVSGSTIGNTALLGSMLLPEMRERGYSKELSMGPIMAAGGLAMLIPPSALAVVYGSIANVSIGQLLIAGIVPGLLLASLYTLYTVGRAYLRPADAPGYEIEATTLRERLRSALVDVAPLGGLIFLVVGLIFLGVATPTEAAALGTVGAAFLIVIYRRFNWKLLRAAMEDTLSITGMTFLIISGSQAYSQLLSFSGASRGLIRTVEGLDVSPLGILLLMQLIVLVLGCFMDQISIMMLTIPLYSPIVALLGFDPLWFAVLMLVNLEVALTTPPFGLLLFVMKGAAPADTTMGDVYRAAAPYILCNLILMAILIAFPILVTWLPGLMS